jgi:hypothetical protein
MVTSPDVGLSAHVTPRGSWADLFVESLTTEEIIVRSRDGIAPDAAFDYVVFGLRIGYEDFAVIRPKSAEAFVPPADHFEQAIYAKRPELRAYSAQNRFREMGAYALGDPELDLEASRVLRSAIGEHAPGFDFPPGAEISERERLALQPHNRDDQPVSEDGTAETDVAMDTERAERPATAVVPGISDTLVSDDQGNVYANSFRPQSTDFASLVAVSEPVEAGDVVVIDFDRQGSVSMASVSGDPAVFGVVAGEPGVMLGARLPETDGAKQEAEESSHPSAPAETTEGEIQEAPVAVSGVVRCKVDASYGSIRPGDLLTTSPTPGHAMRAIAPEPGAILGKAFESLDEGAGLIKVLVMLR